MSVSRSPLTAIGVGIVGLVLGVAAGGVLPRAELRELQAQLDEAQSKACETDRGAIGREFASALRGRPVSGAYDDRDVAAVEDGDEPPAIDEDRPQTLEDIEREIEERSEAGASDEELSGLVLDAMSLRTTQARQAIEQDLAPTDEQWDQIDGAIDRMNDDLAALADGFAADFADGTIPNRRDTMIFAADTLDVLIEADDAIWSTLTPEQQDLAQEEAIDPLSHIDSSVLEPFMAMEQ